MKLKLNFSTCPNDTFMFYAMVHNKVDVKGYEFEVSMADIEELNRAAFNFEADIIKISYAAYTKISNNYILLNSGSALGNNNGPLLISKRKIYPDEVDSLKIAIPGENTTANLLLSIAFPNAKDKTAYLFSDIEDAVLSDEVDAGLIIHENRFTYQKKGLIKIVDLGELWEEKTSLPIPLGGIAIKRNLPEYVKTDIDVILKSSIEYGFLHTEETIPYLRKFAQEMQTDVMLKHIDLYVNKYSIDIGAEGKDAVNKLFKTAETSKVVTKMHKPFFIGNPLK